MWDWLSTAGDALAGLAAELWSAIIFLYNLLAYVAVTLWNALVSVFNWVLGALQKISGFFHMLYDKFIKGIFGKLLSGIFKIHDWLEAHLRPLINFIVKVRAYLDRIFRLYIKPFLNMIQHVRQFLQILRLLGVKWAAALDAKLGKVEADIAGVFLQVRALLTGFIDIFNAIADPLSLLRRPTLVLSIRRIIPTMIRATTGLPIGFFFPSPRKNAGVGLGQLPLNFNASDPNMNPPASNYFAGDDGLGAFSGFASGTIPDNGVVNDVGPLDYFDNSAYPRPQCTDYIACLERLIVRVLTTTPAVGGGR